MTTDVIREALPDAELALASGRRIKLLDVLLPEPAEEPRSQAWLASLAGHPVGVKAAASTPDRWGRVAAAVVLTGEPAPIDIAELLVAEGLARVDAGERDALCRRDLLALEASARVRRHGLWSLERQMPIPADDLPRFEARVGAFALVEGRIRSVGERAQRTYLNFGAFGSSGFTVTIPKRSWAILRDRGLSAQALRGRRVRVRGVLEAWRGVAMEIVAADVLEVLANERVKP